MKPILNKIAIIAGLSLLASCQSFFDEDPVYSTTTDTFFNSETALETYAIGFLESHLPSAATLTRGDQYSDICVTTQTEGFLKTGGYSAQQANNWARGNWRPLYNVNYYLKHMKDAAPYVDDATMKHYEGVGRFWRAWFYWDKVKTFGDVPWYDEPIDPDDDEQLYKGRDPRDYVMQKVLEDLDFAATWCSKASKYVNTNVINRYVALALKSRICLYEGTWRKYHGLDGSEEWLRACVAASEELMGDSPYSLVSTAGEETTNYSKVFKSEEPQYTEVILANEFNATLNRFHDASWYYASGSYGQRNSGPKAFVNMYLNLDGTRFTDKDGYNKTQFKDEFAGRDYRLRQTFITPYYVKKVGGKETDEFAKVFPGLTTQLTYYRIIKWNTDDDANESNTSSANSLPVFRYAEILLNEAEAKAELGEMDQTVWNKTIRPLRERSGVSGAMPATADPYLASYYDGVTDKWILECRRERSIELVHGEHPARRPDALAHGPQTDGRIRWHPHSRTGQAVRHERRRKERPLLLLEEPSQIGQQPDRGFVRGGDRRRGRQRHDIQCQQGQLPGLHSRPGMGRLQVPLPRSEECARHQPQPAAAESRLGRLSRLPETIKNPIL